MPAVEALVGGVEAGVGGEVQPEAGGGGAGAEVQAGVGGVGGGGAGAEVQAGVGGVGGGGAGAEVQAGVGGGGACASPRSVAVSKSFHGCHEFPCTVVAAIADGDQRNDAVA